MVEDGITQIKVGNQSVGILGLEAALEEVERLCPAGTPEEIVKAELFKRLRSRNYVPEKAAGVYADAFLHAYKRHQGLDVEEDPGQGLDIKVLGPGCPQCDRLEKLVMEVLAELDAPGSIQHIRDIKEIGRYGAMGMPALVINGKIKAVGQVPPRVKLLAWLKEAL